MAADNAAKRQSTTTNADRAEARREALVKAFREYADDVTAAAQQKYMKSTMRFYGLSTPLRATLTKPIFQAMPPLDHNDWLTTALHL